MKIEKLVSILRTEARQQLNETEQEELERYFISLLEPVSYLPVSDFYEHYSKAGQPTLSVERFHQELERWSDGKSALRKDQLIRLAASLTNTELNKVFQLFGLKAIRPIDEKKQCLNHYIETCQFPEHVLKKTKPKIDPSTIIDRIQSARSAEGNDPDKVNQLRRDIDSLTGPVLQRIIAHFNGTAPRSVNDKKAALIQFVATGQFPQPTTKKAGNSKLDSQAAVDLYLRLTLQAESMEYEQIATAFEPIAGYPVAVLKQICAAMNFSTGSKKKQDLIDRLQNHLIMIRKDKVQRVSSSFTQD